MCVRSYIVMNVHAFVVGYGCMCVSRFSFTSDRIISYKDSCLDIVSKLNYQNKHKNYALAGISNRKMEDVKWVFRNR